MKKIQEIFFVSMPTSILRADAGDPHCRQISEIPRPLAPGRGFGTEASDAQSHISTSSGDL